MIPKLVVRGTWLAALADEHRAVLAAAAARHLSTRRFFRRGASLAGARVQDVFLAPGESWALLLVRVGAAEDGTTYTLPVRFAQDPGAEAVVSVSVEDDGPAVEGALVEAADFPELGRCLIALAARGETLEGTSGRLSGGALAPLDVESKISPLVVEQSHSMLRVGERAVAKLLRALDPGDDTELELGTFLARARPRPPVPALLGWVRHEAAGAASTVLVISEYVENEGTAFEHFRRELAPLVTASDGAPAELLSRTALLARRTAELHRALASEPAEPALAPEPFDAAHGRELGDAARSLLSDVEDRLAEAARDNPDARRGRAAIAAGRARLTSWLADPGAVPGLVRLRCHGDYHLGQALCTGGDFKIVDLGGEPLRSAAARRAKHCPLRDVASLLRSFDYALQAAARDAGSEGAPASAGATERLRGELEATFLGAYLEATRGAPFVPARRADLERLLVFYGLEKCLYELAYELAQRPAWLSVPVAALERLSA